jgi:hypothetical protein
MRRKLPPGSRRSFSHYSSAVPKPHPSKSAKVIIDMPVSFKVADSADCRINGKSKQVTWRDNKTLVIEPDALRAIITVNNDGELNCFFYGDRGSKQNDYNVDSSLFPDVIVSAKR